jgi:hypothetical protein
VKDSFTIPAVVAVLLLAAVTSGAAGEPYALDGTVALDKREMVLAIPTNGMVHVGIIRMSNSAPARATLYVGTFSSETIGEALAVHLTETNVTFQEDQAIVPVGLRVGDFRPGVKYSGTLALASKDAPPLIWRVGLIRSNPPGPVLIVEPPTLKHFSVRQRWGKRTDPQILVTIREQSGLMPLEGIGVTVGTVIAPARANFDAANNVKFYLNGTNLPGLYYSPGAEGTNRAARRVASGARGSLGMAFEGLASGEYTVELKVFADNAQDGPQQKLTLNLQVADSIVPACATLLAAILCSFLAYKALAQYRERLQLRRRIAASRPVPPFYQAPVYSVVWVKTVLKYAEDLARKWLVPGVVISERLDRVPPVAAALREAGIAEERLHGKAQLVSKRFKDIISGHVKSMSDSAMEPAAAEKARTALVELNASLAEDKWHDRYITEVNKTVEDFLVEIEAGQLPQGARALFGELESDARENPMPADGRQPTLDERVTKAKRQEERYAKLNLIHLRRSYPVEQEQLIAQINQSIEEFFFTADKLAWERIKKAQPKIELTILDGTELPEAYQPLRFNVATNDPVLNESYLFNRGLRYEWTFDIRRDLSPLRGWLRNLRAKLMWALFSNKARPTKLILDPKTHSPRVIQFSPWAGELTVSAKIVCDLRQPGGIFQDQHAVPPLTKSIRRSSEVSVLNGLGKTEVGALIFAALFAVISGLLTFYYKNPTFGTLQDYLSLFLWGVGVEQSKNFLQTLQSTKQEFKP